MNSVWPVQCLLQGIGCSFGCIPEDELIVCDHALHRQSKLSHHLVDASVLSYESSSEKGSNLNSSMAW